ncbi:LysM peptidoglycan-binding domain-containing protein [Rufibacter roseus]|uniref:LysM peptidoglycan-binding domain-containing protein n=1 Tax=Rufibacter roseus TaxID=1567108 RepID=A0ABW2DLT9_9BACT|nr:LysM peptidoglycan-binding domain-containing protein [Rufibacter roseus]
MKKSLLLLLLSLICWVARAQKPVVPHNIYFADMHLQVKDDARADIQKIVDAITKHPGYFQKKVDLADAYFPFIERAFEQEGVPTDFKYLVLQESGLVSDAVSTSNAVGFWQFKEGAATELGVKVNSNVDERKHIIESSHGAAKYLLRNNQYYQNWFNALLSYYQGLTGTKALTKTSDIGKKKMVLDGSTNKYLLTFLAHKIAYENAVGKNPNPPLALQAVKAQPGQKLSEIALQVNAKVEEVELYNKWLSASAIPADKEYFVMIPVTGGQGIQAIATQPASPVQQPVITDKVTKAELKTIASSRKAVFTSLNGLKAIVAQENDTKDILALQADISTRKFLRYNDLRSFDPIVPGKKYYLQTKRTKSDTDYHVARAGETMHDIAQEYGVKLSRLLSKNRMKKTEALVQGRLVWLKHTRPKTTPVEFRSVEVEFKEEPAIPSQGQQKQQVIAKKSESTSEKGKPEATKGAIASEPTATVSTSPAQDKATASGSSTKAENGALAANEPMNHQESAVDSITVKAATTAATYPVKRNSAPVQPKAPDEPLVAEVKPAAPVKQKPASVEVSTEHAVKSGETLYAISKQYEVAMEDLVAWNKLDVNAPLALGQKIRLTGPAKTAEVTQVVSSAPASQAKSTSPASVSEHKVAAGETLYSISRKYGITLQELQKWNALGTSGSISIGQKLVVSAPAAPVSSAQPEAQTNAVAAVSPAKSSAGTVTHKVATGESMYQISRKYGVTIKEIMDWNNKPDFNVSVGENLVIKPKL